MKTIGNAWRICPEFSRTSRRAVVGEGGRETEKKLTIKKKREEEKASPAGRGL